MTESSSKPQETPPAVKAQRPKRRTTDDSLKETFESVIIAFILAFVFRAYVVEAFVIPTGSMAPTLLGEHMHTTCGQCGYTFDTDSQRRPRENSQLICPMCHFPNPLSVRTPSAGGDRILVHKYVYSIIEPSRWDVVVFKDPANPSENFIKRLVGLPGERIWIVEGNVYVQPPERNASWRIARKTEARHGYKTQRDLWQPVYHSQYVPLDGGDLSLARQMDHVNLTWERPWQPAKQDDGWDFSLERSYRYDPASSQQAAGVLEFDFRKAIDPLLTAWYPYNQFVQRRVGPTPQSVIPPEDLRLAAVFEAEDEGLGVTLSTEARLSQSQPDASPVTLRGQISPDGQAWLEEVRDDGEVIELTERVPVGRFRPGQGRQVELWFVDQEASLWVEGRLVAVKRFELPMDTVVQRPALHTLPRVAMAVQGAGVTIHQVEVDRDIHYTDMQLNGSSPGLGTLSKSDGLRRGQAVQLSEDQFYCLGDNSPMSSDGRFWASVDPWIEQRMLHDQAQHIGVVPRKLMIGRAFFVYFPAMYPWSPRNVAMIPNFGKLRFIH